MSAISNAYAPTYAPLAQADTATRSGGLVAMRNEDGEPFPPTPIPATPTKGTRTANLSEAPGGKSADNFVGIRTKASDGSITLTQVRMQAVLAFDSKTSKVVKIIAVGPVVTRDGKFLSERFKTYVVTDSKGQPITDIAKAKERVAVMLKYGGITTLTAEQKQKVDRTVQARNDQRDKLTEDLRKAGPLEVKAPGIDYSTSVDRPNRFLGTTPKSQKAERGGKNVKWETDTPVPLTCSAMVVPNVVFEAGVTTKGVAGSVTPQPLTGFFPCSNGLGDKHRQRTENSALIRTTAHPAGFYPGDKDSAKLNKALSDDPKSTPEVRITTYGQTSKIYTDDWLQTYVNIPNLAAPVVGSSANMRAIKNRAEVRTALFTKTEIKRGISSTEFFIAPYSWVQTHIKGSAVNVANPPRSAVGKVGVQSEVGVYVVNSTAGYAPKAGQIDGKRTNQDWHIVNGKVNENRLDFLKQFASINKQSDLYMLSESVMPDWGDRSAGVYVQVPSSPAGGTSSWQATKEKAIVTANRKRYVSVADMAKMLNKVGTELPKYKEFRFVTAATLQRLNSDRISMVNDPKTGKATPMFEAEAWVNTSARVSVGGPGLFLPTDVAPGK
jgi:hypothetical protein